ncbi:hypothetical protein D9M69_600240 [compost metagenome]
MPNTTTVATAIDTLCSSPRTTGCVAITAAAPQMALPAPMSAAVSRSSPSQRVPMRTARPKVSATIAIAISTPGQPTAPMSLSEMRKP